MQTIRTTLMTSTWFIEAVNENHKRLGALSGTLIETVTSDMTGVEFVAAYNSNVDLISGNSPVPVVSTKLSVGMRGSDLINAINNYCNNTANAIIEEISLDEIYVSNSGNDISGNGTIGNPYATLTKLSSILTSGKKILLAKGSTFINDKLTLSGCNNIEVNSYGSGVSPILTGFKAVTGFTDEGGNIWSKQDNSFPTEITNVFIGTTKATLARTANKVSTGGSETMLVDTNLTDADDYWTGAEIVIKYYAWARGLSRCTNYADKTFTIPAYYQDIETEYKYAVTANMVYFIQNHRNCLTQANQWSYDNNTKTLYIYSVAEPSNVTTTYGGDLIYADDSTNVTIKNLTLNGSSRCGVYIKNSGYIILDSITFNYSGYYSIFTEYITNISILNSVFTDQNSEAILITHSDNVNISDNTIDKCGFVIGTERYMETIYQGMNGCGIAVHFSINVVLSYNHISNVSYNGIFLGYPSGYSISNSYIKRVCINRNDGGGMYLTSGYQGDLAGRKFYLSSGSVLNNIFDGNQSASMTEGIYLELDSKYITCTGNTIIDYNSGILLHRNSYCLINNNTIYSDQLSLYAIEFRPHIVGGTPNAAEGINNTISDNLIVNKKTSICSLHVNTKTPKVEIIKDNKYYYPFGKTGTGTDNTMFYITGIGWLNLDGWVNDNNRVNWDRSGETEITPSLYAGSTKSATNFLIYLINPAKTTRTVTAAELPYNDYLDMDGVAQTYPFTIAPYGSKILVRPN